MEVISYEYPKARREFGIRPTFNDSDTVFESIEKTKEDADQWVESKTTTVSMDCIPSVTMHSINTTRFVQQHKGTNHTEGAWPTDVKTTEFVDRQRYLRRLLNEPSYLAAVPYLTKGSEDAIADNNTIDLFEEYFADNEETHARDPPSCKTVAVFKDPNKMSRAANRISWHPDGSGKLAVAYSVLEFQGMSQNMPMSSYIWDVNNPNEPDQELVPQSPLCALVYNPRSPDHIVGGSYNGMVSFWDLRKGSSPLDCSTIELSHHDPVYDVFWIQSRTGNECGSVSTDGSLLWWDIRKLASGPTDAMKLYSEKNKMQFGGTTCEYISDAGATRYLVGTEQGQVLLCDRKAKKDAESQKSIKSIYGVDKGSHHGPVYAVKRNPFNLKYFMTVGDWTARIWMEDIKAPIMTTRYDGNYLTDGCWSPTRPGVFYTTKQDGTLDVWDYFYKQNTPSFSTKVGDCGLSSIAVQSDGRMVALGSKDGTTSVLEMSEGLYRMQPKEKTTMTHMFDRETRREKNLEMRAIQRKRDQKARQAAPPPAFDPYASEDEDGKELVKIAEKEFYDEIEKQNKALAKKAAANANVATTSPTTNENEEI